MPLRVLSVGDWYRNCQCSSPGVCVSDARAHFRCDDISCADNGWNRNTQIREPLDRMHASRARRSLLCELGHLSCGGVIVGVARSRCLRSKWGCTYFCREASQTTWRARAAPSTCVCTAYPIHSAVSHTVWIDIGVPSTGMHTLIGHRRQVPEGACSRHAKEARVTWRVRRGVNRRRPRPPPWPARA